MAISVKCPGCDKTIRADEKYAGKVAACPGCGNKVRIPNQTAVAAQVIEATSKKWKTIQLIGAIGLFGGILISLLGLVADFLPVFVVGFVGTIAATAIYVYGRAMAWWHHG